MDAGATDVPADRPEAGADVACAPGFGDCDGNAANGCETDTRTSAAHCGMCGHACATGQVCVAGTCVAPPCTSDAIRCNAAGSGVERCVAGAWTLIRTCTTSGLPAGSSASCVDGACAFCLPGDGGASCGANTCTTDENCLRYGAARCVSGRCFRRGILACSTPPDCLPWIIPGDVSSNCTFDATDLNGDTVRSCTGAIVAGCTADAMCPHDYVCALRSGRCVAR
jgi:hypothetical protein